MVSLYKELTGRAWTSKAQLLEALDGRGPIARSPHPDAVRSVLGHFADEPDPLVPIEAAMRAWGSDSWVKDHRYPMGSFSKDPGKYLNGAAKAAHSVDDFSQAPTTGELF
jgi:hypothetical protein